MVRNLTVISIGALCRAHVHSFTGVRVLQRETGVQRPMNILEVRGWRKSQDWLIPAEGYLRSLKSGYANAR